MPTNPQITACFLRSSEPPATPAARPSTRPRIPFRWRVRGCLKVNNSRGVPRPSMLLSSSIFFIPREGSTFRGTKAERVAEGGPQSRIRAAPSGSNQSPLPSWRCRRRREREDPSLLSTRENEKGSSGGILGRGWRPGDTPDARQALPPPRDTAGHCPAEAAPAVPNGGF